MSRLKSAAQAEEWSRLGVSAARNGDVLLARGYLARAIDADRRNPAHRHNLAAVFESQGQYAEAASLYAEAAAIAPAEIGSADRLSGLLARYTLEDATLLDAAGLKAALAFDHIDRQAIGEAVYARLKQAGLFAGTGTQTPIDPQDARRASRRSPPRGAGDVDQQGRRLSKAGSSDCAARC